MQPQPGTAIIFDRSAGLGDPVEQRVIEVQARVHDAGYRTTITYIAEPGDLRQMWRLINTMAISGDCGGKVPLWLHSARSLDPDPALRWVLGNAIGWPRIHVVQGPHPRAEDAPTGRAHTEALDRYLAIKGYLDPADQADLAALHADLTGRMQPLRIPGSVS